MPAFSVDEGGPIDRIDTEAASNSLDAVQSRLSGDPECINNPHPESGMTALHWAGANRNLKLAKILFSQEKPKVDPWIKDRWGRLAIDLAIETGNQTLIDLLQRKMFPEDFEYDFDVFDPPEGVTPKITPKFGKESE